MPIAYIVIVTRSFYMNFLTAILSALLSITSAQNVNVETPSIEDASLSQALLCAGREMSSPMTPDEENYLRSFVDAEVHISNNGSFFSGSMLARDLFTYREIANPEAPGYRVEFDAAYIAGLDICIIDITLVKDGIDFMKETALVLPFEDNLGNKDSEIVMNGFKYYRSELLQSSVIRPNSYFSPQDAHEYSGIFLEFEGWLPGLSHNVNDPQPLDDPCGGGVLFATKGIADAISGIDAVIGFAYDNVDIPLLSTSTVADWLFFEAKMHRMKENFKANCEADRPIQKNNSSSSHTDRHGKHYIYDQTDYSDWAFSFFGSLSEQGCGVVAAYNMLVECNGGAYVDLPTLIAMFEAMNVDTLFGCFGANMVPDDYVLTLALYIDAVAAVVATECVSAVATIFYGLASSAGSHFESMAWSLLGMAVTVGTALEAIAVVGAIFAASAILVSYFSRFKHDVAFVIGKYIGDRFAHSTMDYGVYANQVDFGNQSIVCFWNKLTDYGMPNYQFGAHFVYVSKGMTDGLYYCYNTNEDDEAQLSIIPKSETYEIFGASSELEASRKMISSYAFYY
ncbi:MAG: hypothetical protein MJ190_00485 [Bacilli bacterium]|nr:hypothetical protein [Bacilli bacterium]